MNDTQGHVVGDQVLIHVAQIIKNSVRKSDIVGRYGGEEFLVIFVNSSCFSTVIRGNHDLSLSQLPFRTRRDP